MPIHRTSGRWVVCQIGAREHYAVARALHRVGRLAALITDFWCPPGSSISQLPIYKGMRDRWHPDLADAKVLAPNLTMLGFEVRARFCRKEGWSRIIARNEFFQKHAIRQLKSLIHDRLRISHLFSYSYAASELFQFAHDQRWKTILGQIDPGPEEESIVKEEHQRYSTLGSRWRPAPASYWSNWTKEINLSNHIIINSEWTRHCLLKEYVNPAKLVELPLIFRIDNQIDNTVPPTMKSSLNVSFSKDATSTRNFRVLFLGQINLRKGIGRLLDAMRILKNEPITLVLAGPNEIDPKAWSDLPKVEWIGQIPRSEVGRVYQSSDLFILPSLSDGYAITQLEALAHNLPILRSRRCGNPFRHDYPEFTLDDLEPERISQSILEASRMLPLKRPHLDTQTFTMDDLALRLCNIDDLGCISKNT